MRFFNGTNYPETAKSAENDFLHLLVCDNGAATVSHKASGRVFFEIPTLLIGRSDTYSFCTHAQIQKCRHEGGAIFDITEQINAPVIPQNGISAPSGPVIFMNTVIMNDSEESLSMMCSLSLPEDFDEKGYESVLRFPTGIYEPKIDISPLAGEFKYPLPPTEGITLTDENGDGFSVSNDSPLELSVTVTADGSIDVFIPSNAPVNDIGLIDFTLTLKF